MTASSSIELQAFGGPSPSVTDCEQEINHGHHHNRYASELAIVTGGEDDETPQGRTEFSLPPVDGGKDAWLFLAACFVLEAMVWGFPFAFGIFQEYYRTHEPFAGSSGIAIIGTCAMGIMYLDVPLIMALQRLYPRLARYAPAAGLVIMCVALALSSFATTTTQLILAQGVLYAIGGSVSYCPCIIYLNEWFVRRKGFAYGMMWSGTGLGGLTIPLLLEFLLGRYGFRTTLRIWAVALFALTMPLVWFVKPRLPPAATAHIKPFNLGFLLSRSFALYQVGNVVEGVGYFLPGIFLPTYASAALGAGAFASALTLMVLNVGAVIGCVIMGALNDRLHVTTCIMMSTVGAVTATFFLWGLGSDLATLYIFCLVYGLCAGSYTSSYTGIMKNVIAGASGGAARADESAGGNGSGSTFDPLMVLGFLSVGRGIGNIVSGPLSEALIRGMPWQGQATGGYGSGYGPLIAVTGSTAVVGGVSFVFRRIGWL